MVKSKSYNLYLNGKFVNKALRVLSWSLKGIYLTKYLLTKNLFCVKEIYYLY